MTGKIVLTGAGGNIGRVLSAHFAATGRPVQRTDIQPLAQAGALPSDGKTAQAEAGAADVFPPMQGDLGDPAFCKALLDGAHAVVHLAGIPNEQPFDDLLQHNYIALYNLYDTARRSGVKRIVYASSNHATGMYPTGTRIDPSMPVNPDSQYGLSKVWGEALARLYWEKHGIESVCLRIGSFQPVPSSIRHLSTWLSHRDACALVDASLDTPNVGFDIVYGVSANRRAWWDNSHAKVAYRPNDNAEQHLPEIDRTLTKVDPLEARLQGADFAAEGYSR